MKKLPIKRILVVLLTVAVLVGFVLFDPNVRQIDDVLASMSPWWLVGALVCALLYFLGDTGMYLLACRDLQMPQPFFEGVITTMIGFFYSALTPLASGGQPFQIIQMRERGISVGTATSVLMIKFLAWHIALTCIGLVGFSLLWQDLARIGAGMIAMFCIGFLAHASCATLGILLMYRPAWVQQAGRNVIDWVGRVFLPRKPERTAAMHASWERFVTEYKTAVTFARQHAFGMLLIQLVGFVEVISYLSVTYFIYRGLGFDAVNYGTLLLMQAMLSISVAFVPLPGASVASEGGFYALFTQFFGPARLPAMLIWRTLTYYLTIFLGLGAVIIDGFRKKHRAGTQTEDTQHVSG